MKNFKEYITKKESAAHAGDTVGAFANDFVNFLIELEKQPHVNPTRPINPQKAKESLLAKLKSNRRLHKDLKTSIWENFHDWEYLYGKEVYR
jgi:ABC-type thiamine transport system substrate-binding protein